MKRDLIISVVAFIIVIILTVKGCFFENRKVEVSPQPTPSTAISKENEKSAGNTELLKPTFSPKPTPVKNPIQNKASYENGGPGSPFVDVN